MDHVVDMAKNYRGINTLSLDMLRRVYRETLVAYRNSQPLAAMSGREAFLPARGRFGFDLCHKYILYLYLYLYFRASSATCRTKNSTAPGPRCSRRRSRGTRASLTCASHVRARLRDAAVVSSHHISVAAAAAAATVRARLREQVWPHRRIRDGGSAEGEHDAHERLHRGYVPRSCQHRCRPAATLCQPVPATARCDTQPPWLRAQ